LKGIGPAFTDKVMRQGIRVEDILDAQTFPQRFKKRFLEWSVGICAREAALTPSRRNEIETACDTLEETLEGYLASATMLAPFISNTEELLWKAIDNKRAILLEGSQGALLDIDYGTYPYVTSCGTGTTALLQGSGIAPKELSSVIGIVKA